MKCWTPHVLYYAYCFLTIVNSPNWRLNHCKSGTICTRNNSLINGQQTAPVKISQEQFRRNLDFNHYVLNSSGMQDEQVKMCHWMTTSSYVQTQIPLKPVQEPPWQPLKFKFPFAQHTPSGLRFLLSRADAWGWISLVSRIRTFFSINCMHQEGNEHRSLNFKHRYINRRLKYAMCSANSVSTRRWPLSFSYRNIIKLSCHSSNLETTEAQQLNLQLNYLPFA